MTMVGPGTARGVRVSKAGALKATEFEAGNRYEAHSGAKERNKVALQGGALGAWAAAAGAGSTYQAALRHAGRKPAQTSLKNFAAAKRRTNPWLAEQAENFRAKGAVAAQNPRRTAGKIVGLTAATGVLTAGARFKRNEEQGISQGLGRIKAGAAYDRDLARIGKSMGQLSSMGAVASAIPWENPRMLKLRAAYKANPEKYNRRALAGAAGATGVGGALYETSRRRERTATRQAIVGKAERYVPTTEQIAASKAKREAQAAQKAAAAEAKLSAIDPKSKINKPWHKYVHRGPLTNAGLSAGAAGLALRNQNDRTRNTVLGAAGGLAAADAASVVAGQGAKGVLSARRDRAGQSERERMTWADHKRKHGVSGEITSKTPAKTKQAIYESYPSSMKDAKAQRLLAIKNRPKVVAGTLAAGAGIGGLVGARRKIEKKDDRRSPATAGAAGAGAGYLLAPGRSRTGAGYGPVRNLTAGKHSVDPRELQRYSRGTGVRMGERAHVAGIARSMRDKGYQGDTPVRVNVFNDRAKVSDGAHRVHGATIAGVDKVPVEVRRIKGDAPASMRAGQLVDQARTKLQRRTYESHRYDDKWMDRMSGKQVKAGSLRDKFNQKAAGKGLHNAAHGKVKVLNRGRYLAANAALIGGGGGGAALAQHKVNQRKVSKAAGAFLAMGALTGSGGSAVAAHRRSKGNKEESKEALGGLAGGWAGQGAYQGAAYRAKHLAQRKYGYTSRGESKEVYLKGPDGKPVLRTKSQTNKRIKEQEKKTGFRRGTPEFDRRYPKSLPEWKTHRVLGYTHRGRIGTMVGGAATAAGGLAGAELASSKSRPFSSSQNRNSRGTRIAKADRTYGYMERKRNKTRTVQLGVGAGLTAWGASRSPMLGGMLGHGLKLASKQGNRQVKDAVELARQAGRGTRQITGAGEKQLRKIRQLNSAIESVPESLRPSVAMTAGALLAGRAVPVHDRRFVATGRGI